MIDIEEIKLLIGDHSLDDKRVEKIREILYYFIKMKMDIEIEKVIKSK